MVPNALNRKETFQVEKPFINIQALKAIFRGESNLERKIKKAYMQDLLAQHHFKELCEQRKVKNITFKKRLYNWKKSQIYVSIGKLRMKNNARRA